MVKALHITDIHCETHKLKEVLTKEEYDIVLTTGDFECIETLEVIHESDADVLAVTGNTDPPHIARRLKELGWSIEGRIVVVHNLKLGGIGGIEPAYSLEKLESSLGNNGIDVLLTHYPPYQTLDKTIFGIHVGSKRIREFVERYKPRLVLCGHIHEARGLISDGNTIIVNPGPLFEGYYALIDVGEKTYASLKHL
ncbi:MAG: metallophosphoesterase family protein [Desulfurococcales archaeon]|nr:metallophosphoesterase family protein [Desulfurococcales archaeon]